MTIEEILENLMLEKENVKLELLAYPDCSYLSRKLRTLDWLISSVWKVNNYV